MKLKTQVKAGKVVVNHNETLVRDNAKGLKVKTQVKAGRKESCPIQLCGLNHNEILVRDNAKTRGLKVKTQVKAGLLTNQGNRICYVKHKILRSTYIDRLDTVSPYFGSLQANTIC